MIFNSGVEVNVDADFDLNNFGYNQQNAEPAVLNLSGPDSMLYVYNNSDLYYGYKLEINMSDGAYFEAPTLNWGGGGYYKINVDASEFVANFNGQFQGSNLEGGEDSGVYFTNGALARANGYNWNIGDGQGANYRLTVSFDASELMMTSENLKISSMGENAVTKFIAQNASTIYAEQPIEIAAANRNSYTEAIFDNSTLTSGTFKVLTNGSNSAGANAVAILRNLTQEHVSLSGRIEVEGNAADSTAEVRIVDSDITAKEGVTLRGSNGGLSLLTIDNSKVSFVNSGQYLQAKSGATSNLVIKNGSVVYGGSLNIQSEVSSAASNMVTIFGKGSTYDSAALGSVHTANIGTYGGERLEGKYIGMVFGGFDNGKFFAADAGPTSAHGSSKPTTTAPSPSTSGPRTPLQISTRRRPFSRQHSSSQSAARFIWTLQTWTFQAWNPATTSSPYSPPPRA